MTTYNSFEFKNLYQGKRFFKLTNKTEIHNGFKYKDGVNEEEFNIDTFKGLHFCEKQQIYLWIWYNGAVMYNIREVFLPDDSIISIETDCFKTNKFILGEKKSIIEDKYLLSTIKKKCKFKLKQLYKVANIFC